MFENTKKFTADAFETAAFIVRVAMNGSLTNPIRSLKAGRNDCVILGNGPSLSDSLKEGLPFLKDKTVFCMGEFPATMEYERIKPEYCLMIDGVYFSSEADAQFIKNRERTFNAIVKKTAWPLVIIAPYRAKKEKVLEGLAAQNKNVRIAYFNNSQFIGPRNFRHYVYRKNIASPIFQNTLIAGIFFALNMGYRKIFLLGADHSWLEETIVRDDNVLCIKRGYHFFDKDDTVLVPNLKSYKGENFKLHEFLRALALTFEGYFILEDYARYLGSKVYNASGKSYIDAFERFKIGERAEAKR